MKDHKDNLFFTSLNNSSQFLILKLLIKSSDRYFGVLKMFYKNFFLKEKKNRKIAILQVFFNPMQITYFIRYFLFFSSIHLKIVELLLISF